MSATTSPSRTSTAVSPSSGPGALTNENTTTTLPASSHPNYSKNKNKQSSGPVHSHIHTASAPLPIFHPTRASGSLGPKDQDGPDVRWSSRASRKRLYEKKDVSVQHDHRRKDEEKAGGGREPWRAELRVGEVEGEKEAKRKVKVTGDVSFWVAVIFVLGSVAWVVNAYLLYLPLIHPHDTAHAYQAAAWAFVGGTLFEFGSYLMLVESLNTGHTALFGPSVEGLIEGMEGKKTRQEQEGRKGERFVWMGTRSWRDLGYLASAIQMFAATIFWVSTITGLPGVIPGFYSSPVTSSTAIVDVFFWTPQVIGGWGFIISSSLLMLEEQKSWWRLNLTSVGWNVGLWNLIGAWGFMLCGAFGYGAESATWVNYQSVLSTFWGSWAFLIGSLLQLGETLWRE